MQEIPWLFDPGPVAWVQQTLQPGWPTPWRAVSVLGISWGTILVVGLALWLIGRRSVHALLAVMVIDGVLKMALNQVLAVPRPSAPSIIAYEQIDIGSFPSGHTATAAALWGYLSLRRHVPWLLTVAVVALVAISRLYLGVHYPADIFGGVVLAAIVVWLTTVIWPTVDARLAHTSQAVLDAAAMLVVAGAAAAALFLFGDNPYQWRSAGMIAGFAIALPLEYRLARTSTHDSGALPHDMYTAAVGAAGIGAFAAIDAFTGSGPGAVGLFTTLGASLWALLVVPLLFRRPSASVPPPARS